MIVFDIVTGSIKLTAVGENAFIIRRGKKIKIPSAETRNKLIEEYQKTHDAAKLDKFEEEYPKLMEGDTVISGGQTNISIGISYNKGKENPVDDYKFGVSKSVYMGPNSELQVSGFEKWDKTDKEKKRYHGELIKNIELKKGLFSVSYSHTEDVLVTPVALIKFIFDGHGLFDVYGDIVYSGPIKSTSIGAGGIEYTNKLTKKSYIAKSSIFEEIIVTRDAIYRRGLTKMDDIFLNPVQLGLFFQSKLHATMPTMDAKMVAEQYKNMPKTMEQTLGGIEMFKQMSPDDLARMMKMAEAHGAKVSPEMMEKIKEIPEAFKIMEKEGTMKEMKKAMAMGKGLLEGLGNEGIERMTKAQTEAFEKMKKGTKEMGSQAVIEGEITDVEKILESPRKYKPLTDAKRVA